MIHIKQAVRFQMDPTRIFHARIHANINLQDIYDNITISPDNIIYAKFGEQFKTISNKFHYHDSMFHNMIKLCININNTVCYIKIFQTGQIIILMDQSSKFPLSVLEHLLYVALKIKR